MSIDIKAAKKSFVARQQKRFEQQETIRIAVLDKVRKAIPAIVARYADVEAVYLFGSILRPGAFTYDSDIDVAVEKISAEEYFRLWQDLETALPDWAIDLRDLPPDTNFTRQIYRTGEKIYGG
ncbi:MAG TPA: nucleotidyltransferase domain-containing protein [Anaerolineae bacterium]|nr:hypothetical protein [Anaerolineae bacterium]HRV95950.1 nucleotidyltransferase domain-containing protein [Anaerolineae bacterium]